MCTWDRSWCEDIYFYVYRRKHEKKEESPETIQKDISSCTMLLFIVYSEFYKIADDPTFTHIVRVKSSENWQGLGISIYSPLGGLLKVDKSIVEFWYGPFTPIPPWSW